MIDILAISILGFLCVGQAVERYFYQKDMTNKLNDAIKAVLSRNINEYLTAITTPKVVKDVKGEVDEVDLGDASDEVFDKALKKM